MSNSKMSQWLDEKWAIAFSFHILVLLAIATCTACNLLPPQLTQLPASNTLSQFILIGLASYFSYLATRGRTFWVGNCAVPLGPLFISLCVLIDETLQSGLHAQPASLVNLAASLSGVTLFYRLARVQYESKTKC